MLQIRPARYGETCKYFDTPGTDGGKRPEGTPDSVYMLTHTRDLLSVFLALTR